MIETPLAFFTLLLAIVALFSMLQEQMKLKPFRYIPTIVAIYLIVMLLATLGVWQKSDAITHSYKGAKSILLPATIFWLLSSVRIGAIVALGYRLLGIFLFATFSIAVAFVVTFWLFHPLLESESWKAFGALSGSWMGGSANMLAIQEALGLSEAGLGHVLLIDTVNYALWVVFLLAMVPYANRFNANVGATAISVHLYQDEGIKIATSTATFLIALASGLGATFLSGSIAQWLPPSQFLSPNAYSVIVATILGLIAAYTPIYRMDAARLSGQVGLYLLIALLASRADLSALTHAPLYILMGFVILGIHAIFMLLFAKVFRIDLFSLGVASLANIGGIASAPILASAYDKRLIPIGVTMAIAGYIIGTFGGLVVAYILRMIATS